MFDFFVPFQRFLSGWKTRCEFKTFFYLSEYYYQKARCGVICREHVYYILHSTYMRLFYMVSDNFGNIGKMNVRLHKATFLITLFGRPYLMHLLLRFSVHMLSKYIYCPRAPPWHRFMATETANIQQTLLWQVNGFRPQAPNAYVAKD